MLEWTKSPRKRTKRRVLGRATPGCRDLVVVNPVAGRKTLKCELGVVSRGYLQGNRVFEGLGFCYRAKTKMGIKFGP